MHQIMRQTVLPALAGLAIPLGFLLPSLGAAAQSPPADIQIELRNAPLSEFLARLSEQAKRPVLWDGDSTGKVSLGAHGPLAAVLPSVGRSLDADVREAKNGSLLLVPRFAREPGLPQANPNEINVLARSALRTLPNAKPDRSHAVWGDEVRRLGAMLTPPQVESLKSGKPVAWADLSPDQKAQLATCVNGRLYGGPRFFWTALLAASGDLEQSTLRIDQMNRALMLHTPDRTGLGEIRLANLPSAEAAAPAAGSETVDPGPTSAPAAREDGLTLDGRTLTLKQFAERLGKSGLKVEYPAHLAQRRISIASKGAAARKLLEALCELEGWTCAVEAGGKSARIEGPAAGARPGESLYAAIRRLHPPDLANYLRLPPPEKLGQGSADPMQLSDRMDDLFPRLWSMLSPLDAQLKGDGVRLAKLKPEELEMVMLAVMLSHQASSAGSEFMSNSNYLKSRPEATRLRMEQGSVLLIDCEMAPGQVWSFGANMARRP